MIGTYRIETIQTNPSGSLLFPHIKNNRFSVRIRTGKISSINFRPCTCILVFISRGDQAFQSFQLPIKQIFHSSLSLITVPRHTEVIKVTCRHRPLLCPEGIDVRVNFLSYTVALKILRTDNNRITRSFLLLYKIKSIPLLRQWQALH